MAISQFMTLLRETLWSLFTKPLRRRETIQQFYFVANESLLVVVFCVCFAAIVTILESSFHMKLVIQNDSMVPAFASMLILRELGAVVTALLVTSRVGAGIAAEVGTMQITEQVDALKMLGIEPVHFLVVPRLVACILGGVVLTLFANVTCIYMAMLVSEIHLGFTSGLFFSMMTKFVGMKDLFFSMIKGAAFGAVIPLVGCFYGFRCQAGAEGVGQATTQSVVTASIAIIIIDFILTYLFSFFY